MNKNQEAHYFFIGAFVLAGLVIVVLAMIFLGSGELFKKEFYMETYFNSSVHDLSVGTPVKYRGLKIGYVKKICFIDQAYKNRSDFAKLNSSLVSRYVYVKIAITDNKLVKLGLSDPFALKEYIKSGLRVELASEGLTGGVFFEFKFVDSKIHPALKINWKPRYMYIPSMINTLSRLGYNVSYIVDRLKTVDFKKLFNTVQETLHSANNTLIKTNNLIADTKNQINSIIDNLRNFSETINQYPSSVFFGKPPHKLNLKDL